MFKLLAKMFNALSSNTAPGAIAHAFACGLVLGFIPKNNLLWYILFIFILFLNIQRATFSLCIILGALVAPLFDNYFNSMGFAILTYEKLYPVYRYLLDIPFVAFTKFNNTMVMGSLAWGVILYIPMYIIVRVVVFLWRKYLGDAVRKMKVVKIFKQIPLIQRISNMKGW